jgi:hypothetical protein
VRDSDTQVEWKSLENRISDSRKIFRLGKFLDELDDIRRVIQNTAETRWSIKLMQLLMHFFAFNYYFLDNILWSMNVGLLKNIRTTKRGFKDSRFSKDDLSNMKHERNYQSLYRLILATVLDIVLIAREVKRWYRNRRHAKKQVDRKSSKAFEGGTEAAHKKMVAASNPRAPSPCNLQATAHTTNAVDGEARRTSGNKPPPSSPIQASHAVHYESPKALIKYATGNPRQGRKRSSAGVAAAAKPPVGTAAHVPTLHTDQGPALLNSNELLQWAGSHASVILLKSGTMMESPIFFHSVQIFCNMCNFAILGKRLEFFQMSPMTTGYLGVIVGLIGVWRNWPAAKIPVAVSLEGGSRSDAGELSEKQTTRRKQAQDASAQNILQNSKPHYIRRASIFEAASMEMHPSSSSSDDEDDLPLLVKEFGTGTSA